MPIIEHRWCTKPAERRASVRYLPAVCCPVPARMAAMRSDGSAHEVNVLKVLAVKGRGGARELDAECQSRGRPSNAVLP